MHAYAFASTEHAETRAYASAAFGHAATRRDGGVPFISAARLRNQTVGKCKYFPMVMSLKLGPSYARDAAPAARAAAATEAAPSRRHARPNHAVASFGSHSLFDAMNVEVPTASGHDGQPASAQCARAVATRQARQRSFIVSL